MFALVSLPALFAVLAALPLTPLAHPGPHAARSITELAAHGKRVEAGSRCAARAAEGMRERKAQRSDQAKAARRDLETVSDPQYYDTIQNSTCVLAPEVTEGPYYIRNENVRANISEGQEGVPLVLDMGILDINTCEPLSDVFVEIWHCNATGYYSGFTAADNAGDTTHSDELSFLRGGMVTNANGVVEIASIYPGYYTSRTVHIHMMVHENYTISSNGTVDSSAGSLIQVGQLFFDDSLTTDIYNAFSAYNGTKQQRTLNSADSVFAEEETAGNKALIDWSYLGDELAEGILGYVTVGVDTTASYSIISSAYQG